MDKKPNENDCNISLKAIGGFLSAKKMTSRGKTAAWSTKCELIRNSRPSWLHFIRQVLQTVDRGAVSSVENYLLPPLLSWRGVFSPYIIVSAATSDCLKLFLQL